MNSTVKKLLACTLVGVIIAGLVAWARGLFSCDDVRTALMYISDGFFVGGALLLCYGGLIASKNGGAVDGLGYSVKILFNRMRPGYDDYRQSFAEYREEREKKKRSPKLELISGCIVLAVAIIFYIAYKLVG